MNPQSRLMSAPVLRAEQLRRAKRAQRARQRDSGLVHVQLTLARPQADKLAVARRSPEFGAALETMLDHMLVRPADFPQLRDIAWNRAAELIPAREALQLYERNWRFVDVGRLDAAELALLDRLKAEYGNGVINA